MQEEMATCHMYLVRPKFAILLLLLTMPIKFIAERLASAAASEVRLKDSPAPKLHGTPFHILLRKALMVATHKTTRRKKVMIEETMAAFNPFFLLVTPKTTTNISRTIRAYMVVKDIICSPFLNFTHDNHR